MVLSELMQDEGAFVVLLWSDVGLVAGSFAVVGGTDMICFAVVKMCFPFSCLSSSFCSGVAVGQLK